MTRRIWSHPAADLQSYEYKVFKTDISFFLQYISTPQTVNELRFLSFDDAETQEDFFMMLYNTPKKLAESSLVSIPSNDLNRPRPKISRVINLNAARHVIFVSWKDVRISDDLKGFSETECILLVESDYLFIRFWSKVFNSVLSSLALTQCSSRRSGEKA